MPDLSFIRECAEDTAKRNYDRGHKDGYNKAIYEFAKALLVNEVVDKSVVRRVAEQLKEE